MGHASGLSCNWVIQSCNRVGSAVMKVVKYFNSVKWVKLRCASCNWRYTSDRSSELILINSQSTISHATKDLLLLVACMSDPVETQLSSRWKGSWLSVVGLFGCTCNML